MQITAADNRNYNPNFGAIIISPRAKFTEKQQVVVDSITEALRKPLKKFNNMSAEAFYKSKKGIDFVISGYEALTHTVSLDGYKGMKLFESSDKSMLTHIFKIGVYDNKRKHFSLNDIDLSLKNLRKADNVFLGAVAAMFIAVASYLIAPASVIDKIFKPHNAQKTLIENVDSVKNNAKSIAADSAKVFKMIKK